MIEDLKKLLPREKETSWLDKAEFACLLKMVGFHLSEINRLLTPNKE